jgi:hypothetical protein
MSNSDIPDTPEYSVALLAMTWAMVKMANPAPKSGETEEQYLKRLTDAYNTAKEAMHIQIKTER